MTLRLTVRTAPWLRRVAAVAADYDDRLIAVVKGNGYGFGRRRLAAIAARLLTPGTPLAVGTAYELPGVDGDAAGFGDLPPELSADRATTASTADTSGQQRVPLRPLHVLVPARTSGEVAALAAAAARGPVIATVAGEEDLPALAGVPVAVTIKLVTSMRRFGVPVATAPALAAAAARHHRLDGFAAHLPLGSAPGERVAEACALLEALSANLARADVPRRMSLSHLDPGGFAALQQRFPEWELEMRLGTSLWHGAKEELHLGADVLAVREIEAGERAGYHATAAPSAGWLVLVGTGSAAGVVAFDDGRSPFHHRRRRLALFEPPHMHSSMLFVPRSDEVPAIGETVDVQRPLNSVTIDELCWQ